MVIKNSICGGPCFSFPENACFVVCVLSYNEEKGLGRKDDVMIRMK